MVKLIFLQYFSEKEESTRNCLNAKVVKIGGNLRVDCSEGKELSRRKSIINGHTLNLIPVLSKKKFASPTCENCSLFNPEEPGTAPRRIVDRSRRRIPLAKTG